MHSILQKMLIHSTIHSASVIHTSHQTASGSRGFETENYNRRKTFQLILFSSHQFITGLALIINEIDHQWKLEFENPLFPTEFSVLYKIRTSFNRLRSRFKSHAGESYWKAAMVNDWRLQSN